VRGLPDEETQDGVSPLTDVEKLVIEGRYGRADLALRRLEALIPSLAATADTNTLLLALYGRALLLRQEGATTQNALAACDVLERAAHEREAVLWVATACATRARFRVDSGDIGGATADLARADAEAATGDLTSDTGYRLLDALALVYAGLRLHDRADEVRGRIEHSVQQRRVLDQGQHWSTWAGELAARAMEPLAGGAPDPEHELMGRAIEIAAKLDALPEAEVPSTLRRGARGVRALSAAYRGRPSEALRLLGPDAFGTVGDLPLVERQIVSLAAMRAHALVGSLATARSLDDAATTPPATLPNLILEVCRTRERLWLETYAGGDVIPVLHRMTELLVRLGWRGMDLVADTARQALEHQALRTESRTDALTGVGNRRALDEELRQLLRFGPLPLALILVDIDHFKGVNDVYTHVVGDEVLKRVAASLSLQLRTDDQLLRYGGDEFVVLLPGTGDEEADAVAGRMRAAVSDRPWSELADGLQVSITTGVAAVWSLSGRRPDADAEKLFRRADERLLEGKRSRPEVSRSHTRPPLPAAPVPPAAPEPPATPSAEITVMVGTEVDGFDRPGITDVRIANAGLVNVVPPDVASDPAFAEADSDDELDDEPDLGQAFPGSTPARSRITSHAARPAPDSTDRQSRSVFGPDPDVDLETETAMGLAARPSGRRDARPRAIEVADVPRRNPPTSAPPMRSRREARAAGKPDTENLHETSASRDAAEAEAAAREVAKAQADDARKRAAREARARADAAHEAEVRARAEAEKAAHAAEVRDRQAREQAAREQAAREAAAREQAAREQAAREQAEREQAAREQAAREKAEREQAAREKAARETAAREKAAREAAAREKLLREAADRERAAQQAAAREAAEAEARAKAAREQAAREQAEREQAEREQAAREAAETAAREAAEAAAREAEARAEQERRRAAERARVERERREAEAREQEVREAKARAEQARRAAEAREKERRDAEIREQAAREKAAREQAEKEQAAREAAEAAAARAAAEAREAAEAERRRAAERARVEAERRRAEQERRAAEAREKQRREEEAKAEQERREAKAEQARLEAAARARAERELVERQRVEQERLTRERREREQREAEARVAEQRRQEARARAEAEARTAAIERARVRAEAEAERARAADRIREEAYARAAEQARRAATGSFPMPSQAPSQSPGHGPAYEPASNGSVPLAPAAGTGQPLQRRTPLYDASQPTDAGAAAQFRERRSHPRPGSQSDPSRANSGPQPTESPYRNGQNGFGQNGFGQKQNPNGQNGADQPDEVEQDGLDTTIIRTRRQPFGPVTRSQAIIDLSARKRPRSPYSS
jgi:diguanylate cyclase (GGDEF)-like protein